jgi:hypothetical protein
VRRERRFSAGAYSDAYVSAYVSAYFNAYFNHHVADDARRDM